MGLSTLGTNPTLLFRVRDRDDELAWGEFVDLYAPMIYGYLKRCRLQDTDAADLTQEVMVAANRHIDSFDYDPGRGRFRGWLQTITRNKARSFFENQKRRRPGTGDTAMLEMFQQVEDPSADMNAVWDAEYNQRVSQWALEKVSDQVQPRTLQAFVETAVENRDPATVATELGMSYLAKARVISRIREQIEVIGDA